MPARVITVRGKDAQGQEPDVELEDLLSELDDSGQAAEAQPTAEPAGDQAPAASEQAAQATPPPAPPDEPPEPGERDTTVVAQYFGDDGEWDDDNRNVGDFLEDPSALKALAEETIERFEKEPLLLEEALKRIGEDADKDKIMARLKAAAALPEPDEADKKRTEPVGGEGTS